MRLRWVLGPVLALVVACSSNELDCFDQGPLEASYRDGETAAQRDNTLAFAAGEQSGLALTFADGEREGAEAGYLDGYFAGYHALDGYPAGYAVGYDEGRVDGSRDPAACSDGRAAGYSDGEATGYTESYDAGYAEGYSTGGSDGYAEGAATCGSERRDPDDARVGRATQHALDRPAPAAPAADPEELRVCYARGYDELADESAYTRGFEAGKAANPDYQAGFRAAYPPAYANGERAGVIDGYEQGLVEGYTLGYEEAYFIVYDDCYLDAYGGGYEDGYAAGWEPGWSAGYSDGFGAGYDEGAACGG